MTYLTTAQVAERLNVCKKTILQLVKTGEIRAIKLKRKILIAENELERIADEQTKKRKLITGQITALQ